MFGDHDAIMSVTAVADVSPPAPSPPAASVNGRPAGGVVPWRGTNAPGDGGPPPPGLIVTVKVVSGVVVAPPVADTPRVWLPMPYLTVGHVNA